MSARAARVFPGPGEDQASRMLHDTKNAARRYFDPIGTAHAYPPASVRSRIERMDDASIALGRPPLGQLSGIRPQLKELFRRDRNQTLQADRVLVAHDFLRLAVREAANASSR